jgi:hypothetical protein
LAFIGKGTHIPGELDPKLYRTKVGQQAEEIIAGGGLLPYDIMLKVIPVH